MFKGIEWLYFVLCIIVCVGSFLDREYIIGSVFTIITIIAIINVIMANMK